MALLDDPTPARTTGTRSGLNEIVPGLVYQRAKILTWSRDKKLQYLQQWGITAVVNFWPKIDPDLGEAPLDWYWQISTPRSEGMLDGHVEEAARAAHQYVHLGGRRLLVLCEAGKTRSVFFCVLLVRLEYGTSYAEALSRVSGSVPGASLKRFMVDWLRRADGT